MEATCSVLLATLLQFQAGDMMPGMHSEETPFWLTEDERNLIIAKRDKEAAKIKKKDLKEQLQKIQKELNDLDPKPVYNPPYRYVDPWTGPSADDV